MHLEARFTRKRAGLVGLILARALACFGSGPRARTYALVAGAVVLWASWPALATLAAPAPPFLVLGLSALVGALFSFGLAARTGAARGFFSVPMGTLVFVAFGLMGNNAFYLAAITRIGPADFRSSSMKKSEVSEA